MVSIFSCIGDDRTKQSIAKSSFKLEHPIGSRRTTNMEMIIKKLQQKYARVKDEMENWDELQSCLASQFSNAASIIERLQVLRDSKNYGGLQFVPGIEVSVLGKQLESLEIISLSIKETMKKFYGIVMSLEKMVRDVGQFLRAGSTPNQMQQRIGTKPSLAFCLEGLSSIHEMLKSQYQLKVSIMSALTWNCSSTDISGLRQLLLDQPNLPRDEVQSIFDIIFAEEIC